MKIGAVIATSIELIDEVIESKQTARVIINNYIKRNRFIGAKDKKFIYNLVFNTLKKYFGLIKVCNKNKININSRNLTLLNFLHLKTSSSLEEVYEGKYSINKKKEDKEIFNIVLNIKKEILPAFPVWIEKKISISTFNKIKSVYEKILTEPKFDIAINILSYSRKQIKEKLTKLNIKSKNTSFSPYGITIEKRISKNILKKFKKDFFEVQDEGSQIMTALANIVSGAKVIDLCAGKGTKTIFIKNIFLKKDDIFAYDIETDRLLALKKRIKELDINNIKVLYDTSGLKEYFDVVLCDVPCTGTGTWRRRPENIIRLKEEELNDLVKTQSDILCSAANLCKKGGEIIYITCSLVHDENEEQIEKFLKKNKNFELIDVRKRWNNIFTSKLDVGNDFWFTLTPDILETDGYFISILKKKSS